MRIKLLQENEAPATVRELFAQSMRKFGKIIRPMMAYGYCPSILSAFMSLNDALTNEGLLPLKVKALASLRVAQMIGCPF